MGYTDLMSNTQTPRKKRDHLTPYRRHAPACTAKDLACDCPLWVQGRIAGKYIRESLSTRSLGMAELKIREMLNPHSPDGGGVAQAITTGVMSIAEAEAKFLKAKSGKAPNTVKLYTTAVGHFRRFAEAHGVVELRAVEPYLFEQYFSEYGREWEQRTKIGRLTHLRVFFNYAKEMDWIVKSPAAKKALTFSKPSGHAREAFSHADLAKVIQAIGLMPEADRDRTRALILLMVYSGMRISDATFAQRASISADRILDFVVIKTRKRIGLPIELNLAAVEALRQLPGSGAFFFQPEGDYRKALAVLNAGGNFSEELGAGRYLTAIRETTALVVKALALAGLPGACHRFRDTFAINMLVASGGENLFVVSKMLGHSDVKITANHYLNLVPGYRERMSQSTRILDYHLPLAS
jgi:integrase